MARNYHRASVLNGVREVAKSVGQNPMTAMHVANIDPAAFFSPDELIDFNKVNVLFEHCAEAWDLPDFGLRIAPFQQIDVLGPISLVTKIEKDVRSALAAIMHNLFIQSDMVSAVIVETGDLAELSVELKDMSGPTVQYILLALAVAQNVLEDTARAPIELCQVSLRSDDKRLRQLVGAYFRCPVQLSAERNAIFFERAILDRKLEGGDLAYRPIVERYLSTAQHEAVGRFSDSVRKEIARQMELGHCTLENVARSLRMESRSLQRRLSGENLSFRDLVDDWRKTRAAKLLSQTNLPLSEISLALGYADQSIFSRAFQRWHGQRPLAYRKASLSR
ncbi:helix-turn-helix transcriptional regulator [Palleronia caenipelagi]|uniref:AraC family transcriptional regulator n=1 Tax=Palleronia caenipelagi TaxID=2489174 RepID=A0A547Q5J0_9RHOB|nr:AraC family transcriptional regulator [Palleronia caenipelagi]TRD21633.1 AraC family transcriptional regulator [Palleronia caenipelagi]